MASLLVAVSRFLARYQSAQTGHCQSSIRWQSTGRSGFGNDGNSTSSFGQSAADASSKFGGSQGTSSWHASGGFAGDQIDTMGMGDRRYQGESGKSQQYSVARGTPVREHLGGGRQYIPIPDKAPFGLKLLRTNSLQANDIMYLFRAHNPTRVRMLPREQAHIFFTNRDDLVAALKLNRKEEVHRMAVLPSSDLHRLSQISDSGPFFVYLHNLPEHCNKTDLMEIFKEYNPVNIAIVKHQKASTHCGYMQVASKDDVFKVIEATGSMFIQHITVHAADIERVTAYANDYFVPIPDNAPFGLTLAHIGNLQESDILCLFKAHNPTRVRILLGERAIVFFNNRDDLVAAMELDRKEAVHGIRVFPSIELYNLSKMGGSGPFVVYLENLPQGCTVTDLVEIFKEYNPTRTSILISRRDNLPFAIMTLTSKEDVINAFEASGASCVQRIVVLPTNFTMKSV